MSFTGKAFDVSWYQDHGPLDYRGAKAAGYDTVLINVVDGVKKDPEFDEHYDEAASEGFKIGAYHFVYSDPSPEDQVGAFRDAVGSRKLDLPPILDIEPWEKAPTEESKVASLFRRNHNAREMSGIFGSTMPYTYKYALEQISGRGESDWLTRQPIWLAWYRGAGDIPGELHGCRVCMHQWTGTGRVGWAPGNIDLNVYNPSLMPWAVGSSRGEIVTTIETIEKELDRLKQLVRDLSV